MVRNAMFLSALVMVPSAVLPAAAAQRPRAVFTDPDKAGPDFAVQGEYVGKVKTEKGEMDCGAQVIALGNGRFRSVGYYGGLPGAGWNGKDKPVAEGQTRDGVTTLKAIDGEATATIKDSVMAVVDGNGQTLATLKRIVRKSPTLGKKPPEGAVVLFDGKTAENFKGGRMTEDGLLMEGATSKQTFQSFSLHLEFRTPFMPYARGQERGNSGFYAQGRYETQILDSFGLEGLDNECGGIYEIARPTVNMCLPPLSWQTYDIEFTAAGYKDGKKVKNATLTVRHNGVLIHKDQEVPRATRAAPVAEGPEPGPVYLQDHGCPVRFRNIWVVEKK
jgi:hypothetical protein